VGFPCEVKVLLGAAMDAHKRVMDLEVEGTPSACAGELGDA
jgi:hypothetical protein